MRKILLVAMIIVLVSGLSLFALTSIRNARSSTVSFSSYGSVSNQYFQYSGETVTPDNPPQFVVGTTGAADLILLKTAWRDFTDWICHQPEVGLDLPGGYSDCPNFGGGDINVTALYSYLNVHPSQIAYSQTIIDQNVTINYPVTTATNITAVLAPLKSGIAKDYWFMSKTNQTVVYPLIGYTERSGTLVTLPSLSWGLIIGGTIGLVALVWPKPRPEFPSSGTRPSRGASMKSCPKCGRQNLFFADKCLHCRVKLTGEPPMVELTH